MSRDALVVGINTYNYDRLTKLSAPAQDAEAIAQLLENSGEFKVKRLPAVKDKQNNTIRVGQTTKVTLTQLEEAIVQLFKPQGRNIPDTALLYFSGHGLRKDRGIQEGYLATSDVNPDLGNWGIRLKWLRELLQESPIRQQIIWLDCCYSGELLNFAEADPGDRGKGRDRCFIAASREFEVAYEAIDSKHSVLTEALLQGLDPRRHSGTWVTNYTLIDVLNQRLQAFPQSPIFANSGGAINLTRTSQAPNPDINSVVTTICPYRGLQYFDCTEEDAKYFYGREALTDQLLEKVRVGNFLAVLGASGSGKSSVVRAGLLYQLTLGRRLSGSDTWQIRIFQPGEHPLESLARAFLDSGLSDIDRTSQLAKAEELIAKGSVGLGQLIDAADTKRVILMVDQFEEVFTLCKDIGKRQQFFECLLDALHRCGDKLCLVLTMRADFFGKCAEYGKLTEQIQENLVTVTPMTEEELRQAITEPAKQVSLQVEPELVNQMIVDVEGSPGSLPLLQYTLTELWQQRSEEKLTISAYTRLGGVKGTLQKRATEIYEGLSPEEQAAAKRIFLELTQLGEGTEDTRRRVLLQDLVTSQQSNNVEQVIQKLADAKLVVTSTLIEKGAESGKVAVVDVAHEALIRHWSLLRKWLDENRDKLRQKRKIEAAAEEWREKRKAKDYLLQGKPLQDAKAFQKQQNGNLALSNLAEEFISKSLKQSWVRSLKTASLLTIPILVALFALVPYQKQQSYSKAWEVIRSQDKKQGKRAALELLTEGCWERKQWQWIPSDVAFLLFGGCPSFVGEDLSSANLRVAKLSGANLTGANLSLANLSLANLSLADLNFADLNFANLSYANLGFANLTSANLSDANLSGANLSYANLSGANLSLADLSLADLSLADLYFADLSGVNLSLAENLTPEQVKSAKNWEKAIYDDKFRQKLGLK
ncbi:pentapeptide repeat-containing protein [Scytonema hofmannii FACHB-248]|uniref:Pentapeptide repeat-containing protein n=1 Tax=Scytonema hofmannii FACHB-248 TaxID=1842502 RepID=A0ABR8GR66_9CYAN|nr:MULTISPECIES: pentapeptide repeat-containing protein [Nostocales]MBD2605716.1 pentapeptide repeat-containing protein [Scytonema hofmannii FACHB-248]